MGSIREISYETDTARFHISVFKDIGHRRFTADYFGYAPKTMLRMSSNDRTGSLPRNIVSGRRHSGHLETLVKKCRRNIERRFGKIVTVKVIERVPDPHRPGHIRSVIHAGDVDSDYASK